MASDEFPGRILHQTCIYNNGEFLADLLQGPERTNINAFDAAGRSVVYSAVSNYSTKCLSILLQEGANPDIPCTRFNGQTPLHQAALDGKDDMIRLLLDHSADFLSKDNTDKLPLDLAREMKHHSCVRLLKDAQDSRDGQLSKELEAQLMNVAECDIAKCNEYAAILDEQKVKSLVNKEIDRLGLMYRACILKRADLVEWFIKHGADAQYDKSCNQTPLYAACRTDCLPAVTILLEHFPALLKVVTSSSVGKLHCLHLACQGSLELLKVLMEWTYSDELLEYHYTSDRKYCYRSAFDVNVANFTLWSPLYFATASNQADIVRYLLQYEVKGFPLSSSFGDLSESDIPQALANIEEYIESDKPVKTIRPVDACQAAVDSTAPLHHAARNGYVDIAELLIQHRADINQVCEYQEIGSANLQKYTPLLFAVKVVNKEMISLLLKNGVRDDDPDILFGCFLESNTDLVTFILKHKAYANNQHKMIAQHMAVSKKFGLDDTDAASNTYTAVGINWHGVNLNGQIFDEWIYASSLFINPQIPRSHCLDAITAMDVSSSGILALPAIVFTLQHLVVLNADSNRLQALPNSDSWHAPNLKEVTVNKNGFFEIPEGLLQLPALERLSMCDNNITAVTYALWTAPMLIDINLAHNKIRKVANSPSPNFTSTIRRRPYTQEISLSDTNVDEIGEIVDIPSQDRNSGTSSNSTLINNWSDVLEVVDVFESSFNPDATLTTINLSHNALHQVPYGLACLAPKLQRLDLSHNNIDHMGSVTMYPVALVSLNLSYNKLPKANADDIDDITGGLHSPKNCYSSSRHRDISTSNDLNAARSRASTGSSSSLSSLASQLCRHRSLRFDSLTSLNLSHNKITEIAFTTNNNFECDAYSERGSRTGSTSDLGLLYPKLTQLDLSHNEIRSIPPIIAEHSELSQLNLRCNLVKELPPAMGLLKSLWNMELTGCPLEGTLAEKVEMKAKTSDIIGFLNSVLKDAKPYASMKLMIVGQANIGKTTLLAALRREERSNNPFRHFNQRVSNASVAGDSRTGDTVSTVGVDIGDLTFERRAGRGKVVFKTWDFGGQEEYYATHQYFLSKRSLYLVLYKLTDGESAMDNIKQWLVNIQTRSPGAPVIIVGSHLDMFKKSKDWKQKLHSLREKIKERFMVREPATVGLPNVRDIIEVSKPNYNIPELANMIHKEAWALKAPGSSSMPLLDQRIPAIYIQLEQVVALLAAERLAAKKNPVLNAKEYRSMVNERIKFRDSDELSQATQFLHDNGVLLHYQDVALSDLYFLDPQWLCDMLAHVITIKPINGFVKSGIMKTEHLEQLFRKSAIYQSDDLQTYIISLLSKFELALRWDEDNLLLPSLLPSENERDQLEAVKLPVPTDTESKPQVPLCQSSAVKRRNTINSLRLRHRKPARVTVTESVNEHVLEEGNSTFYVDSDQSSAVPNPLQNSVEIPSLENSYVSAETTINSFDSRAVVERMSSRYHESIRRIYLLSYIPSGFWPRLISRIYSDHTISILTEFLFDIPRSYADLLQSPTSRSWQCWKTGLALQYITSDLLKVRQVHKGAEGLLPYYSSKLLLSADNFKTLQVENMNVLEVEIPDNVIEISQPDNGGVTVYNTRKDVRAKLLAKVMEHLETLLEDWYPDLGERFQQNTRGDYLVRRLVMCPSCIEHWLMTSSTRTTSVGAADEFADSRSGHKKKITCYSVEELLVKQYDKSVGTKCKAGHSFPMSRYAPDLVFADIYNTMSIEDISLEKALGKGAFGVVFTGILKRESLTYRYPGEEKITPMQSYYKRNVVAVKTLQPHDPGQECTESLRRHYEQAARKWKEQTSRNVFTAYCNARQEINILNLIQHPNIVSLVGVLLKPLSLILERAPFGSLQDSIDQYSRAGCKLPLNVIKEIVIQVASALVYLHNESKLIYRDLKAENVLVWAMPTVHSRQTISAVEVRLADFGVSRAVSDRTAKGMWGTPGYMAPEVIEFQGKEEYTEKVDCYAFGSFLYELITLKRPFHNGEGNINSYALAGKRPAISSYELFFPTNMLDLMVMCWNQEANMRPTAEQIVNVASHAHFSCLQEVLKSDANIDYVTNSCVVEKAAPIDMAASIHDMSFEKSRIGYEVYMVGGVKAGASWQGRVNRIVYGGNGQFISTEMCDITPGTSLIAVCCAVESTCWMGDSEGDIHVLNPKDGRIKSFHAAFPLAAGRVKQLLYAEDAGRVFCLLNKGLLIEYDSITLEKVSERKISELFCSTMVQVDDCLWIGLRDAYIKILPIHELLNECESVSDWMSSDQSNHHLINHYNPVEQLVDTAYLVTDTQHVWSNVYPGSHLYRWSVKDRVIENSCDIAEIISTSPGQDPVSFPSTQLVSVVHHCSNIIAGSTSGYVVVVEGLTLAPLICLSPHATASYRTLYSIQPLPGCGRYLTLGEGYKSIVHSNQTDSSTKPNLHALTWYINPSESL